MNHLQHTVKHILTALLLCTTLLCAQKVRHGMEQPPYYKHTPFTFQVSVSGEKPGQPPQMAPSSDFIIQPLPPQTSSSTQVTIINGDMKKIVNNQTTYNFRLTPKRTGRLYTPACTVTVDGRTQTIAPRPINVEQPNLNQTMTLSMTADRSVAALGQPIRLDFRWTVRIPDMRFSMESPIQGYQLTIPALNQDNLDAEPVTTDNGRQRNRIVANEQTQLETRQYTSGNKVSILFSIHVIPRKPGKLILQPATIVANVADPNARRSRRSIWDNPFFDSVPTTRCAAESKPIAITVKEPPAQGRPDSYTGLAEACTITVTADKKDVYVGDPIILDITLRGPKFPASVILPKLQLNKNVAEAFRVFDSNAPGTVNQDGSVTFQRTIRATSPDVKQIPPLEIAWFDATKGSYQTAASQPIPLTVKATKNATPVGMPTVNPTPDKIDVTINAEGPRPNLPPEDCSTNQRLSHQQATSYQDLLVLLTWPALALLLLIGRKYLAYHRRNAPLARRRKAAATAIEQLQKAAAETDPAPLALNALQAYLAAKTQQTQASITLQDMEQYLTDKNAPLHLLEQTRALVSQCEAAVYAKQPLAQPQETLGELQQLIQKVEQL